LDKESGSVRMARHNTWPLLKNHALYSLRITDKGMREPHWHPMTAELGYVEAGHARMSILTPQGETNTYLLQPGDVYFIPKAYPHHIENVGTGSLHFLLFFDQPMPGDVGFSGSIRGVSDEVLASLLHVEPSFFGKLTKYYKDLFLVDKINSVDS
jgi:oxalate decarboxylase